MYLCIYYAGTVLCFWNYSGYQRAAALCSLSRHPLFQVLYLHQLHAIFFESCMPVPTANRNPGAYAYRTSKSALNAIAKSLYVDLKSSGKVIPCLLLASLPMICGKITSKGGC